MSDEMVQEQTETVATVIPENSLSEGDSGEAVTAEPVSSTVGASATTDEPAPAPPVAEETATETPAPVDTPVESSATDDAAAFDQEMQNLDMSSQYDKSLRQLQEGDVITGTVMRVDREGVLVDVGAKSEGIIRLNELSRDPGANANPESVVKVGERIKVYVLEPENQEGNPILSKKRADFEQAWERVQQAKGTSEVLSAMVTDRVKGGLVVDLGIRGFVPASHVGSGSLKNNLDKYVGQSILLKVIEVDRDHRKVVLSNKLAVQEEREVRSAETKASLIPDTIRRGVVRRLTNYGAFIDLGGIDGLLHISEMSWTRINDPKEVLREGQELDVLILKMDLENNRVSLGLRQILPDPWADIPNRYKEGDVITGQVTRTVPFGAFVQVDGGVEGIIPNTELPRNRGNKGPGIAVGDEVQVKVLGIRHEERKMTLSMRALMPPEEQPVVEQGAAPPRESNTGAGRESNTGAGRESSGGSSGGGGKRRGGRDRNGEGEDYSRYVAGRQEEPRFGLGLGDALKEAQRQRSKRERRATVESEEYIDDAELEAEVNAEVQAEAQTEATVSEATAE